MQPLIEACHRPNDANRIARMLAARQLLVDAFQILSEGPQPPMRVQVGRMEFGQDVPDTAATGLRMFQQPRAGSA